MTTFCFDLIGVILLHCTWPFWVRHWAFAYNIICCATARITRPSHVKALVRGMPTHDPNPSACAFVKFVQQFSVFLLVSFFLMTLASNNIQEWLNQFLYQNCNRVLEKVSHWWIPIGLRGGAKSNKLEIHKILDTVPLKIFCICNEKGWMFSLYIREEGYAHLNIGNISNLERFAVLEV